MTADVLASPSDPSAMYAVGLNTTRFLLALGDLVVGWLLLRQAEVALEALGADAGRDAAFYEGKVAAASFFARTVLPRLAAERTAAALRDPALMDLPVEAF